MEVDFISSICKQWLKWITMMWGLSPASDCMARTPWAWDLEGGIKILDQWRYDAELCCYKQSTGVAKWFCSPQWHIANATFSPLRCIARLAKALELLLAWDHMAEPEINIDNLKEYPDCLFRFWMQPKYLLLSWLKTHSSNCNFKLLSWDARD